MLIRLFFVEIMLSRRGQAPKKTSHEKHDFRLLLFYLFFVLAFGSISSLGPHNFAG
jgi:hypothetical protein